MKEQDLLEALGQVSDQTVKKYALPDAKAAGTADDTAGKTITQRKKKPFRIHMGAAAAAIALCLGLNAAFFYGIHKMRKNADSGITPGAPLFSAEETSAQVHQMPSLIGMNYDDALVMYGNVIQIEVEAREYSDYEEGVIFEQEVPPNDPVSEGATVKVKVSRGIRKVALPDVTGWDYQSAQAAILELGLKVEQDSAYDPNIAQGKVICTDPQGPIDLARGSVVRVTVSLGADHSQVTVPDFTNMQWNIAKETAERLHLSLKKTEAADAAPAGTVLRQSIQKGLEVDEGTEIELTVSGGIG